MNIAKVMMDSLPAQLTPEEIADLEAAEKMPITFDEDRPEMTSDMLKQFHRMDNVTIKISPSNMKKIRALGSDPARILSRLIDLALDDADLVQSACQLVR